MSCKELISIGKEHKCEDKIKDWIFENVSKLECQYRFSDAELECIRRIRDEDIGEKTDKIHSLAIIKMKDDLIKELFHKGFLKSEISLSDNRIKFSIKLLNS